MLDRNRIEELRGEVGDDGFAEVIELFCEEVEEVLDELASNGPADLAERLHFLKGSALNIGMVRVGELCMAEEDRLRTDDSGAPDIAAIRSAYATSRVALEALL